MGWKGQLSPADAVAAQAGSLSQGQWHVLRGLSPSGYEVGTSHYEPAGNPLTSGTGSAASTSQSMVQVSTYKDPTTGAIMEVRLTGTQVDGQFVASGSAPLVLGMDTAGRTVLTGAAAQAIAAAQLNPSGGNAMNGTVSVDSSGNVRFMPAADYYGVASFKYQVTDSEGASTWATAHLTVQGVNDAPMIEDIWYGRPVYGFKYVGGDETPWFPITNEGEAWSLIASGILVNGSLQRIYPEDITYYRSGQMRPIAFDQADAFGEYSGDTDILFPYEAHDDPLRQNGGVVAFDPDGDSSLITFSIASGPVHGHALANVYVPWTSEAGGGIPDVVQRMGTPERGAWQYLSHLGDMYTGADPFSIRVTDVQGASTTVAIASAHAGSSPGGGGGGCPIVIDLTNDGIDLIRPEDSNVFMDINGDGWRDRIGWAAPSDAVLVLDANQDGRVDIDTEVSFVDHLPGARTDLEGLVAHDSNGDGWITCADERWKDFGLFQDRNANGVQDEGEFISLDAAGLQGISLTRESSPEMNQGNVVFGTSAVAWDDGRTSRAGDVMFAGDSIPWPQAAQMALLFNQMAALPAQPGNDRGMVYVPPSAEDASDAWVAAAVAL